MFHRLPLASLILALFACHAAAQNVRLYRAGEAVDPQDVVRILDQTAQSQSAFKMRSIRLLDDAPAARVAQADHAVQGSHQAAAAAGALNPPAHGVSVQPRPAALALPVQFGFDSAEILTSARYQLDALAAGIHMLPAGQSVVIEGHTDAAGTDQYNEQLSHRRAQAVKRYLVAIHGIAPNRLRALGLGEKNTLAGLDPYAAENRRVQFHGE